MKSRSPSALVAVLWLVLIGLGWSVTFLPIVACNDVWWHVKTGQYILQHGIPRHDIFSYTAADHEWDNHEWLSETLMGAVFNAGEAGGLGGFRAVILLVSIWSAAAWAMVAYVAHRRVRNWPLALLIGVWAVAIGRRHLYPRPPVLSYFLFAVSLWILYEVRLRRWPLKHLAWLVPLTALWSNLHGAWMALLVAIVFFMIDAGWRWIWHGRTARRPTDKNERPTEAPRESDESESSISSTASTQSIRSAQARKELIALALTLFGCVLASMANPYGWRLYLLPGRVMGDAALSQTIGELQSPNFYYTLAFEAALLFVGAGLAVIRRRPVALPDVLLFLFWGHQGIQHVRHLPMFAVAAAPLMAVVARELLVESRAVAARFGPTRRLAGPYPWVLGAIAVVFAAYVAANPRENRPSYPARNLQLVGGLDYDPTRYPTKACDFVLLNDIRGRLFNQNHYAGYLIWRLSPEHDKVFSDSRFDIFGGKFWRDESYIIEGYETAEEGPVWSNLLDQYKVEWCLIPTTAALNERLRLSRKWELVYHDGPWSQTYPSWAIWIRKTPENEALRARCQKSFETIKAPYKGWSG